MCLHDFLARSFDILTLLSAVEHRQAAIAADLAELEGLSMSDAGRGAVLVRLQVGHRQAAAELDRAFALLSGF